MLKNQEDQLLVRQLRERQSELAFRKLYEKYYRDIYAFGFSLLKSKARAEDLVQEVFLKVWINKKTLDPDLSFRSFIFTITRNLAFNTLSRAANSRNLKEEIFYKSQKNTNTTDHKLRDANYKRLKEKALSELTPRCKQVFQMSRYEGKTYREIGDELGVSENTVRNQMSTALATIRDYLIKHGDIVFLMMFLSSIVSLHH